MLILGASVLFFFGGYVIGYGVSGNLSLLTFMLALAVLIVGYLLGFLVGDHYGTNRSR